ncbi:hypothetical protein HanHA89_Chr03g0087791 [Helianthus annuus]|nr:hypothetical protein HanHA89_Chr03g0087791 [Helianthus annuus]
MVNGYMSAEVANAIEKNKKKLVEEAGGGLKDGRMLLLFQPRKFFTCFRICVTN